MKKIIVCLLVLFAMKLVCYSEDFYVIRDSIKVEIVYPKSETVKSDELDSLVVKPFSVLRRKDKTAYSYKQNLHFNGIFEDIETGTNFVLNKRFYFNDLIPVFPASKEIVDKNNFRRDELFINTVMDSDWTIGNDCEDFFYELRRKVPNVLAKTTYDSIRIFDRKIDKGYRTLSVEQLINIFLYFTGGYKNNPSLKPKDKNLVLSYYELLKEVYQYENLPDYSKKYFWMRYLGLKEKYFKTETEMEEYKNSFLRFLQAYEKQHYSSFEYASTYGIEAMRILNERYGKISDTDFLDICMRVLEISEDEKVLLLSYSFLVKDYMNTENYDKAFDILTKTINEFQKAYSIDTFKGFLKFYNIKPIEEYINNFPESKGIDRLLNDLDRLINLESILPSVKSYLHLKKGELLIENNSKIELARQEFEKFDYDVLHKFYALYTTRMEKIEKIKNYNKQKLVVSGLLEVKKNRNAKEIIKILSHQYNDVFTYSSEEYGVTKYKSIYIKKEKRFERKPLEFNWIKVLINDEIYFLEDTGYERIPVQ